MFSTLYALIGKDCGHLIITFLMKTSPFIQGRAHQLVLDKTKNIPNTKGRRKDALQYIKSKSQTEILHEALLLTQAKKFIPSTGSKTELKKQAKFLAKTKPSNDWDNLFSSVIYPTFDKISSSDQNFNDGRAFQFLLDTDHKVYTSEILDNMEDIEPEALKRLTQILEPKKGDWMDHRVCDVCVILRRLGKSDAVVETADYIWFVILQTHLIAVILVLMQLLGRNFGKVLN